MRQHREKLDSGDEWTEDLKPVHVTYNVFNKNLRVFLSDLIYDDYTVVGGR